MNNDKSPSHPTQKLKRPRRQTPNHSATDKAQAVLAIWTDRARPAEVCRQLQIPYITLHQWQKRAMEGMLQALESRVNLAKGEALSPRLQALLQHQQRAQSTERLSARLRQIQKVAKPNPPAQNPQ